VPGLQDYSAKLLRYVAASPGQEFMTQLELRRPKPAEEDAAAEGGQQPQQVPVTFRILDEHMPLLEVGHSCVDLVSCLSQARRVMCRLAVIMLLRISWHTE
jgi:hypothetical protein